LLLVNSTLIGNKATGPIASIVEIEFGGGAGAKLKPLGWPGRLTAGPFLRRREKGALWGPRADTPTSGWLRLTSAPTAQHLAYGRMRCHPKTRPCCEAKAEPPGYGNWQIPEVQITIVMRLFSWKLFQPIAAKVQSQQPAASARQTRLSRPPGFKLLLPVSRRILARFSARPPTRQAPTYLPPRGGCTAAASYTAPSGHSPNARLGNHMALPTAFGCWNFGPIPSHLPRTRT